MSGPLPEKPAPRLERPRMGARAAVHWKCRIGRRIQRAREEAEGRDEGGAARLTRERLAQRLALSPWRLWEMENGLLGVEAAELAMIGEALGVHPGYFFDQGDWRDWVCGDGQKPAWILARTIAELDAAPRAVLESLALYFGERRACGA